MKKLFILLLLFRKKRQLVEVQTEHAFFRSFFGECLNEDEGVMREELSIIRSKKQTEEDTTRAVDLERKINTVSQVKTRLKNAEAIEKELTAYIALLKKSLCFWR